MSQCNKNYEITKGSKMMDRKKLQTYAKPCHSNVIVYFFKNVTL